MPKIILSLLIFLSFAPLSFAQTFSASPNDTIPDNNTIVSFDIIVSGLPTVIDTFFGLQTACLNITHTYDSDLEIRLQSPDGTTVTLFSGVGGGGHDFVNTCLEGTGALIGAASAPFTGTFQSMGVIGNVNNGQNPNGTWHLLARDMAGQDVGVLQNWQITFSSNPAMPFIFASSNIPIVKFTTLGSPINNDVKVPVLMQIIDNGPNVRNYTNQTNYAYEGQIMTEWQGFSGSSYPKKSYDFEVVDNLGVKMDTTLLGMTREHDWIFKSEYTDLTMIKNRLTYEMARRMGGYAPDTRPCEIIMDGEYIGYYTLTEKVKRDANRVNIAKLDSNDIAGTNLTGGYIIEMNINGDPADWTSAYAPSNSATACCPVEYKHVYPKSNVILPVQHDYIHNYVDTFENVLNGANFTNPTSGYRKYIDIQSVIDFLIVNEFSVNYDSYGRSTYLYKEKDTDGGKLKYGPPWDYDRAYEYNNPAQSSGWVWQITHPYWPFPFHWARFWQDTDYRKELACRWLMLRQNTLRTDSFMVLIDSLSAKIYEAQGRNYGYWAQLGGQGYNTQIDSLKSFVTRRLIWLDTTLANENVAPPIFYLPTDTTVCYGTIYDASFNGNQYSYNWQPGPDTSMIPLLQTGTYTLQVTDKYGCYSKKNMDVNFSVANATFTFSSTPPYNYWWTFVPVNMNGLSYSWNFGDGSATSQQVPSHHYAASGNYIVTLAITDSSGCTALFQDTVQYTFVDVEEASLFAGEIYPNPFTEKIEIRFSQAIDEKMTVSIVNELGQTLFSQGYSAGNQTITIPTSEFSEGVYLLKITKNDKIWTQKVVKRGR